MNENLIKKLNYLVPILDDGDIVSAEVLDNYADNKTGYRLVFNISDDIEVRLYTEKSVVNNDVITTTVVFYNKENRQLIADKKLTRYNTANWLYTEFAYHIRERIKLYKSDNLTRVEVAIDVLRGLRGRD